MFLRKQLLISVSMLACFALTAVSQSSGTIEVPFEFYRNEIVIQAKINGQGPFTMLVDTGTNPSAIDIATAQQIGLRLPSIGHSASGAGTAVNLAYECKFSLLEIGQLSAKHVSAGAIDLSKINERLGRHIDGVVGHSLMRHRIVQIDYPAKILRFFEKTPYPRARPVNSTSLQFRYNDGLLIRSVD